MDHDHDARNPEGMLAASLYEPLPPEEQALLDAALAGSAELRALRDELAGLVAAVPRDTPPLDCDLLPLVRARIDTAPAGRVVPWRRALAPALAAAAAVAIGIAVWQAAGLPDTDPPAPRIELAAASPLEGVLGDLSPVLARREFGTAVQALRAALADHADDPAVGRARLLLADLEFSELRRYAEAHTVYEELKARHPDVFSGNQEAIFRLDLLAEARVDGFTPLHALDAAGDSFDALEGVVAQYPNKHVAGLALAAMQRVDCGPDEAPRSAIAALESLRDRCTNPVALAQVNLSLGELYWSTRQDPELARAAFLAVAAGGDAGSADIARQALAQLDAAGR